MAPVLILLGILAVTGLVAYLLEHFGPWKKAKTQATPETADNAAEDNCHDDCGLGEVCPASEVLRCESQPVVYYDDQELDAFRGRGSDEYSDDEIEQWRDILYTLRPDDILGWGQSVKRRGIIMPAPIHDEFLMLYNDRR